MVSSLEGQATSISHPSKLHIAEDLFWTSLPSPTHPLLIEQSLYSRHDRLTEKAGLQVPLSQLVCRVKRQVENVLLSQLWTHRAVVSLSKNQATVPNPNFCIIAQSFCPGERQTIRTESSLSLRQLTLSGTKCGEDHVWKYWKQWRSWW